MRLLRLAKFNIRKHKVASIGLVILIFFCQLFLGLGIHNIVQNNGLFARKAQEMEAIQNLYCIENDRYQEAYEELLRADERVSKVIVQDAILLWQNNIKLKNGEDYICNSIFLNQEAENLLENVSVPENRDKTIEHPIYAPFIVHEYYGFEIGDELTVTYHQQTYTFEIAGFYETTIFANGNMGAIKFIISNEDYQKLYGTYGGIQILGYNVPDLTQIQAVSSDFIKKAKEMASGELSFQSKLSIDYLTVSTIASMFPVLLAYILLCFATIIFITIFIVIRHRITSNIEQQMVSIGTLEALGYTSKQMTRIYMIEYGVLAIIGTILGSIVSHFLIPMVNHFSFMMIGLSTKEHLRLGIDLMLIIGITLLVGAISFTKARSVKKYPPIVAFRQGISNHYFKKNYFALYKVKHCVHYRLAGKRLIGALKQNIIIAICITAATATMLFSIILYNCCGGDQSMISKLTGFEMSDIRLNITHSTDAEVLKQELLEWPEIRKVSLTHDYISVSVDYKDILVVAYPDYSELETIATYEGRMPIYDNEIGITGVLANIWGKEVGDSIEVEYNGYSMRYLISGITQSMINNGQTLYFNEEGIKHIVPSYESNSLNVYLTGGADKENVINRLKEVYGKSIDEAKNDEGEEGSTKEERIKAKAEEKIASLMALYGVDSVDYAVMIDGQLIKGNSKMFAIEKITDMEAYIETNIGAYMEGIRWGAKIIVVVSALIILVILTMLIRADITRQRADLGIYKGLGYTTKELMLQMVMSIIPAVILGIILGNILAIWSSPMLLSQAFSIIGATHITIEISKLSIILLDLGILVFSLVVAIFSAYRIKDISVYQLLTE